MRAASSALALAAIARAAAAQPSAADQTFERGRKLLAEQRYAEACSAFEQSQRLDPQSGTLYNLADCETHLGKLATAWEHYRQLERSDANAERRAASARFAAALAGRVPKLVIELAPRPPGAHLVVDGVDSTELIGVEIPVDLGDHAIAAQARGFRDAAQRVIASEEGKVTRIVIRLDPLDAADVPAAPPAVVVAAPPERPGPRRRAGRYVLLGGAGLTVAGLVVGGLAWSAWDHAKSCTGCDRPELSHHAAVLGDWSTGLVVAGLAAAGAGLYLWRTSSSQAIVTPQGAGVALTATF
ncbi:MAG TPA: hypothetical protein VLX92_16610 [Kofleriaceae bacterium]|nr:hypothetical protein [Kofleriaceae bacterium]